MKTKNIKTAELLLQTNRQYAFETSKYLNLPDLMFFNWCKQKYQVNRGVYNTIDQWFFEYGIINIYYRRIQLLAFLDFVKEEMTKQDQPKFIRFCHGGLSKRLNEFVNDSRQNNVIPLKKE